MPPFSHLDKLLRLKKEKEDEDEKAERLAKKAAEGQGMPEEDEKKDAYGDKPDPKRFDILQHYDFVDNFGTYFVHYDNPKLTLFDIFQDYGTEAKPKEDPAEDPEPPKPKPKEEKVLAPPVKKDEEKEKDEEEKEGEDEPDSPSKVEIVEEEPEEVFIPPVEKVLWYDFDAFDGKDPVLLALTLEMIKGEEKRAGMK